MKKSKVLSLLAGFSVLSMLGESPAQVERERKPLLGNQGWGRAHSPKTIKSRAKEKRAKTARKINWI